MRRVIGARAVEKEGASTSQMGRFETEVLTELGNMEALMNLPGMWIDRMIDIAARLVRHARCATFQMAETGLSRQVFGEILKRIHRLALVGTAAAP